jgi:hypothetical protein
MKEMANGMERVAAHFAAGRDRMKVEYEYSAAPLTEPLIFT